MKEKKETKISKKENKRNTAELKEVIEKEWTPLEKNTKSSSKFAKNKIDCKFKHLQSLSPKV